MALSRNPESVWLLSSLQESSALGFWQPGMRQLRAKIVLHEAFASFTSATFGYEFQRSGSGVFITISECRGVHTIRFWSYFIAH